MGIIIVLLTVLVLNDVIINYLILKKISMLSYCTCNSEKEPAKVVKSKEKGSIIGEEFSLEEALKLLNVKEK